MREEKKPGIRKGTGEGALVPGSPEIDRFNNRPVTIKSIKTTERYTIMYLKGRKDEMASMMAY